METVAHFVVRAVVGGVAAGLFAFVGYVLSNLFLPPAGSEEQLLVNLRLIFVGAGAGLGALAGWSIRDETRPPLPLVIAAALIGGFLGAWVGLIFAEGTSNVIDLWTRHLQITQATILSAAIGANLLPFVLAGLMAWISRRP